MSSSFAGIELGKRSLMAQSQSISTAGHNISNADTEGYSRQRVQLRQFDPIYRPDLTRAETPGQIGQGVSIESISRIRDELLDSRIVAQTNQESYWSTREKYYVMLEQIYNDVIQILMPRVIAEIHNPDVLKLFNGKITYHVNPTGKFVIGGPHGDTGLTGRKIIVDTYGGAGAHGGGAFSGKDPSKVDRSAAYAARHIAKNLVAAGVADEILVQVSYAIGVARPINIYVNTYGRGHVAMSDGEIAKKIEGLFDMRPRAIEERLKLRNPIYSETAAYGHMGREPKIVTKHFESLYEGNKDVEVELFTWEKLDYVDKVKAAFGLK